MSNESRGKWEGATQERVESNEELLNDHEERISTLEKYKQRIIGALIVLAVVSGTGAGVSQIIKFFGV